MESQDEAGWSFEHLAPYYFWSPPPSLHPTKTRPSPPEPTRAQHHLPVGPPATLVVSNLTAQRSVVGFGALRVLGQLGHLSKLEHPTGPTLERGTLLLARPG